MTSKAAYALRKWIPRALPTLQQGSTVSIRSNVENSNIFIQSKWQDIGHVWMEQMTSASSLTFCIDQKDEKETSLGRQESHLLLDLRKEGFASTNDDLKIIPSDEESHRDTLNSDSMEDSDYVSLNLEVPEKVNIDCDLSAGGSVTIQSKIEGDVRIRTLDGDISVQKLRGYSIDLQASGQGNSIYASDLLEAKDLMVQLPHPGRLRAKRIHASSSAIRIGSPDKLRSAPKMKLKNGIATLFDADDSNAVCDISSFYVTGDANIDVYCSMDETRQAVRLKSNHGHVTVTATSPMPSDLNLNTNEALPVVDMGGVNGSCEVFVKEVNNAEGNGSSPDSSAMSSLRVHFDSVASDSVSIVRAEMGNIHVTTDRKVESDLRLLSTGFSSAAESEESGFDDDDDDDDDDVVDLDTLLLDEEDEDFDDLQMMLRRIDDQSLARMDKEGSGKENNLLQMETKAFTSYDNESSIHNGQKFQNIQYLDGWIENKSEEPDSRFDRKVRGETGSVGKIRLDGASNQALHHFQNRTGTDLNSSSEQSLSSSSFIRPMIAIVGPNKIRVETLSWLGNIAQRYGLDDTRSSDDLGRTATRRGRSLDPQ